MKSVHILNGQEMYQHYKKTNFLAGELLVPFNEAMCYGDTCDGIFSREFIDLRSHVHQVTPTQYEEITIKPLKPLFDGGYSKVIFWFDADMFCQINLLTVLAWLDQIKYQGEADLHLVGNKFEHIESYSLAVDGHEALYKQVLLHKENPKHITPSPLKTGVELYLNYMKQDSDLMLYIQQHQHVPDKDLISLLLKNFKKYGLGDTQYEILIKMNRGFNR